MADGPAAVLHNTSGTEIGTASNPIRNDPTGSTAQPVSGTVTANIGTSGSLALDATLTGGTQKAIVRGGAKGTTTAADVTSTTEGTDHQGLDVQIYHGGTAKDPTQIRALTSSDVVTSAQGTAAALSGGWPVKVTDGTNSMPTMDTAGRSGFERVTDGTNTAAVKAASTAAIATDPALVVAVSPNNTPVLPNGASTAAKQPSLGTAGSPSADVISVQGVSGGTPQPISGTVTANIGTVGTLALDATLTGGTQKAIVRGGAKGTTTAADVTSTAQSADRQGLDVQIRTSAGVAVDSFGGGTQYADGAARGTATGTLMMVDDGTNIQSASGDANGRVNVNAAGIKTNNNAAPGATNIGTLSAIANASAPSWTEGNQVGLSTLLNGAARIDNTSWLGSTAPSVGQKTMANSLPMTLASDQTPPANPTDITGTITTLNGTVSGARQGYSSIALVLTGTWTGGVVFEASSDGGTTWITGGFVTPPPVVAPMPQLAILLTANGTYQCIGASATTHIRIRAATAVTGTINVRLVCSVSPPALLASFASIQQNITNSVYNSSTANIASGASFTGTAESTLGVECIDVALKSDQPCTVQIQQSPDSTNWDIVDSYQTLAGTGWSQSVHSAATYVRVVVTNLGSATTTYFRLQTTLCPVSDVLPRSLGPQGGLKIDAGIGTGSWVPATPATYFGLARGARAPLSIGADGTLQCYSTVLTDCGSYRDDYIAALQSNLTGTVSLTNGSTIVTGSGCAFTTELDRFSFIKLTAHADSVLASVLNVIDDNTLTLAAAYGGATGSGVGIKSSWYPNVGTGGGISVSNSNLVITSGTTNGQNTYVQRGSDYGPMEKTVRFSVSQRIANQTVRIGFFDSFTNPKYQACIELTGTDNTQVTLTTRSNTGANDVESTTVTLPTGINTGTLLTLKLDLHQDRVMLSYDPADGSSPTFLAMSRTHIPPLYYSLLSGHGILNTGVPASGTTLTVDMIAVQDYNLVNVKEEESLSPQTDSPTVTSVAGAVASTLLMAANKNRKLGMVYNDSTAIMYLKLGSGASTTSFTARLVSNAYYELPIGTDGSGNSSHCYNGAVYGYWASATGNARVTEVS